VEVTNVLIPSTNACYRTIASSGFFFLGRLRVPTRRCDLVVPADGGWGHSNEDGTILVSTYDCSTKTRPLTFFGASRENRTDRPLTGHILRKIMKTK
jgi:hypothetical protein